MFESNPKKTIKEVSSLPAIGDAKTIYRLTTDGNYYAYNSSESVYKKIGSSDFFIGGTPQESISNKSLDIYRIGKIGLSDTISNFSPRYALDVLRGDRSFVGVGIIGSSSIEEVGYIIATLDDTNELGGVGNKGWKLHGNPDAAFDKPNAFFITHWNGAAWLPSMQFHATTGSVTVGNVPSSYTPANYFEVWGDAKFSAKIEDAGGSYGTIGQYLTSNGNSGGVRWTTLIQSTATTGTTIDFISSKIYNLPATPATGNITNNLTNANIGIVQKLYHQSGTAPTFPSGWVLIGTGTYSTTQLNIIYAEWVTGTRVEYWIVNTI